MLIASLLSRAARSEPLSIRRMSPRRRWLAATVTLVSASTRRSTVRSPTPGSESARSSVRSVATHRPRSRTPQARVGSQSRVSRPIRRAVCGRMAARCSSSLPPRRIALRMLRKREPAAPGLSKARRRAPSIARRDYGKRISLCALKANNTASRLHVSGQLKVWRNVVCQRPKRSTYRKVTPNKSA